MSFPTSPPMRYTHEPALRAARSGNGIYKYYSHIDTLTAAFVVQTDANLYQNIPVGQQVVINCVCFGLETTSDDLHVRMVKTQSYAGVGDEVIISKIFHCHVGQSKLNRDDHWFHFDPQIVVKYSAGLTCVSMEAQVNDTDAIATIGWLGWLEREST